MPSRREPTSAAAVGAKFERLVEVMRALRAPTGCPWDREQTLSSLRSFVLEEAYEVAEAIDLADSKALRDELGDLVFEVVFLAQVSSESGCFGIADALDAVTEKLVRRHPHVFDERKAGTPAATTSEVAQKWEEIKAREQTDAGREPSLLGNIPAALPSLLRANRLGRRAATVGFDWSTPQAVLDKIEEEIAELRKASQAGTPTQVEEEIGDLLFAVASLARHHKVEPETALLGANRKFAERFAELEHRFRDRGIPLRHASLEEMEHEWEKIKGSTPGRHR